MIEPQPNKQERLRGMCDASVSLESVLLGSVEREAVPFHLDDLGDHQSLNNSRTNPLTESVPMKTLDGVVAGRKLVGSILLKADVQGYELEVLRGANETLRK